MGKALKEQIGNGRSNVAGSTPTTVYVMAKPLNYGVESTKGDQGNYLGPGSTSIRNLVNVNPVIRNMNGPVLPQALNPFVPSIQFPNADEGNVMQPPLAGTLPGMSLSAIGGFNPTALSALGGDNTNAPTAGLLTPNFTNTITLPPVRDEVLAGNRRKQDEVDGSTYENSAKRMRLAPLLGAINVQTAAINTQIQPNSIAAISAAAANLPPIRTSKSLLLYLDKDQKYLSGFQTLARRQIELFESSPEDLRSNRQGRNKKIIPGQVGIRCIHCKKLPILKRKTGNVYYPTTVRCVLMDVSQKLLLLTCLPSNSSSFFAQ